MNSAISFTVVSYANYFENLSFDVEAGSSTLIVTSRLDEHSALFK